MVSGPSDPSQPVDAHHAHAGAAQLNGAQRQHHADLSQILQALQAIYDPASTNVTRRQATEYLESVKNHPQAPEHGRTLALDRSQPAQLRHYGLTLLEHSITYRWEDFTVEQGDGLRNCVVELAHNISEDDPVYIRNKVAQLWTEVAKRSWGAEWMNMDEQLVALWGNSLHHQAVVLYVLETLSEEVFNREDATAGLRGHDLGRACVEIFTDADLLAQELPTRDKFDVRCGKEGWLNRLCANLEWCLSQDFQHQERVRTCAVKTMSAIRASMTWIMPKAIGYTQVLQHVSRALAAPAVELQLAAIDVIHAINTRPSLSRNEADDLMSPLLSGDSIALLTQVYSWSILDMDVSDIDEQKYTLCKKTSEVVNQMGLSVSASDPAALEGADIPSLLSLLYEIARNPSLFVAIPSLHCWTKLLKSYTLSDSLTNDMLIALLQICSARLMRYEAFPEDTDNVTVLFLNEDVDTVPERHAFLGNFRRYCSDVIETVVRQIPVEAMSHILSEASSTFQNLYQGRPAFDPQTFAKTSMPVLSVDAYVTIIDAALRGYLRWKSDQGDNKQESDHNRTNIEESFEQWCRQLLQARFEDPEVSKKIIQIISSFSTRVLPDRPAFALTFLEYLLTMKLADNTSFTQYSDAVKDLERMCSLEMQKLAMKFPNDFMNVYDSLDRKINELVAAPDTDERQRLAYNAFLFIIIHRCTILDRATQEARMKHILGQVKDAWASEDLSNSVSTFQAFCGLLGMDRLPDFLLANNFQAVQDWSEQSLSSDGQALQAAILERSNHLPLRLTKTLLAASIEKLDDQTPAYEIAASLWADALPAILPNILQLVSHAQAFNNIEANWAHLPPELQQVIRRVLTDRFWQAGISTESREDFFARISSSKSTYEGFASTVRGTVRQIRESSYYILYSLTLFRDVFYGIPDLPGPLSQALYSNATALSAHHLSVLLGVSTHLIEGCPRHLRSHFLPPVVEGLFRVLDSKISSEWEAVNRQVVEAGENDNLTDEMKTESILRQLTFSAISLATVLLDPKHDGPHPKSNAPIKGEHTVETSVPDPNDLPMYKFILRTPSLLETLLLFCNTILRVRDTRSVTASIRILRHILPAFRSEPSIRAFFSDTILKSAITSLHEPYFVDAQKDLATLIAAIVLTDVNSALNILLSLPVLGNDPARVQRKLDRLQGTKSGEERLQRSIVLDMLSGLRGVSIHELGKVEKRGKPRRRTAFAEQYMGGAGGGMQVDEQGAKIVRGGSPALEGVAGMFGDS